MNRFSSESPKPAAPPRGVAFSGTIVAVLFIFSLVLGRLAFPANPTDAGEWLSDTILRSWVVRSFNLIPFAGIAFLWFMAVLRHRIGLNEDRFFATVFLGSGLLFIAMLFVLAALAQGLLVAFPIGGRLPAHSDAYAVGRAMAYALMNTFALKMAAVFIFATSTLGLRTGVFARWISFVGYVFGLVLLLVITEFAWTAPLFPAWVLLVSAYFLIEDFASGSLSPTIHKDNAA